MRPTPVHFRRAILEVERKFVWGPALQKRFSANDGNPQFHSIQHIGELTFEDIYFDREHHLSASGIWVRRRNGRWQAKIQTDHENTTFANTRFEELSEPSEILQAIRKVQHQVKYLPTTNHSSDVKGSGLDMLARFTTFRDTWRVNDKFEVVLDRTDFKHFVGEVELLETIEVDDERALVQRRDKTAAMDQDIETFMNTYQWAFPRANVVGKLSAYLQK
ncbi:hypothetical protein FQN57_003962 [Myotisia sp. PD_48]|nr:hypothetical protein FQN57_003962 [Myotisia sp. PD_48]